MFFICVLLLQCISLFYLIAMIVIVALLCILDRWMPSFATKCLLLFWKKQLLAAECVGWGVDFRLVDFLLQTSSCLLCKNRWLSEEGLIAKRQQFLMVLNEAKPLQWRLFNSSMRVSALDFLPFCFLLYIPSKERLKLSGCSLNWWSGSTQIVRQPWYQ